VGTEGSVMGWCQLAVGAEEEGGGVGVGGEREAGSGRGGEGDVQKSLTE
jgi:hypothetical protein